MDQDYARHETRIRRARERAEAHERRARIARRKAARAYGCDSLLEQLRACQAEAHAARAHNERERLELSVRGGFYAEVN